jgi:hypothetical protein
MKSEVRELTVRMWVLEEKTKKTAIGAEGADS